VNVAQSRIGKPAGGSRRVFFVSGVCGFSGGGRLSTRSGPSGSSKAVVLAAFDAHAHAPWSLKKNVSD
jgi:hypothetical protein